MIKAVVKFFGTQQDQFGMPVPYHSYLVVSSPWQTPNSGIASVVPLSSIALHLTPPFKRLRLSQTTLPSHSILTKVNGLCIGSVTQPIHQAGRAYGAPLMSDVMHGKATSL